MIKAKDIMLVQKDFEKFEAILDWCKEHPLQCEDVYENNAYAFKHRCEKDLGFYVSADDVAVCYALLGNVVEKLPNGSFHMWIISEKRPEPFSPRILSRG